jgi:hypothetical protein
MKAKIVDGMLVVEIPLQTPPTISASGKTLVVASSRGNVRLPVEYDGKPITVGFNAYIQR